MFSSIKIKNRGVKLIIVFIKKSFAKNPEKGGRPAKFNNPAAHIIFILIPYLNSIEILETFRNLNAPKTINKNAPYAIKKINRGSLLSSAFFKLFSGPLPPRDHSLLFFSSVFRTAKRPRFEYDNTWTQQYVKFCAWANFAGGTILWLEKIYHERNVTLYKQFFNIKKIIYSLFIVHLL